MRGTRVRATDVHHERPAIGLGEPERGQGPPGTSRIGTPARQGARCLWHGPGRSRRRDSGFTLIELVVTVAIASLLVSLALPSYLGARKEAAIDEANLMADQWRTLVWGCFLQANIPGACDNNAVVGFLDPAGKYWDWTSASVSGYHIVVINQTLSGSQSNAIAIQAEWPSRDAGLEDGETFVVELVVIGSQDVGRTFTSCIPNIC